MDDRLINNALWFVGSSNTTNNVGEKNGIQRIIQNLYWGQGSGNAASGPVRRIIRTMRNMINARKIRKEKQN